MLKNSKRFCSLLTALSLVFAFAGCKKSDGDSNSTPSDDVEYITEFEYVDENGSKVSSGTSSSKSQSERDKSKKNSNSSASADKGTKNYSGTTVRYATWKDPELNEDGPVIKAFEKKYGIKVEIDLVGQSGYNNTIAGRIASGNSPDVYYCNMFFPNCLSCLQPISAAELDLSDPIWDKSVLDLFTINGKTYLVGTVGNVWSGTDCIYFNKTVLKQAGFTEGQFPDQLYKKGVWTWDALETIMSTVKTKLGDQGYTGAFLAYDTMICSTGCNMYKYNKGTFSANTSDSFLVKVNERLADWYTKGYIHGFDTVCRDEFLSGKVAIAAIGSFGLKKTGYWAKMNQDSIGFTYLPNYDASHKAVKTGLTVGWGICKGAKNPKAAGVFLRYYLDGNNYDTSKTFMNDNAATFFFEITSGQGAEKNLTMIWNNYTVAMQQPSQVKSTLASLQNSINEECKSLNNQIKNNTK